MVGLPLDLDDPNSVARFTGEIRSRFPDLNVLLANSGISRQEDLAADGWDASVAEAIVGTNILGVLRTVGALLPMLKQRLDATIMAITSNLAFVPRADFPTYCASKAFLHSWLQSLRHQLRHVPIEVLELAPRYVQTELTGRQQADDPCAMPLVDYAAEVVELLAAGDHPDGEVLVMRDRDRPRAEREGRYEAAFAAINPG